MKKTLLLVLAVSLIIAGVAMATVVSSKHDMRSNVVVAGKYVTATSSSTSQVCVFCHHPHRGSSLTGSVLLWNISDGNTSYLTYQSPTTNSTGLTGDTVNSSSDAGKYTLLCMGCHDGGGANNAFVRATVDGALGTFPSFTTTASSNLGATLVDDHPVDFTYPDDSAPDALGLSDVRKSTNGVITSSSSGTTNTYPLFTGTMQCATCHDVHNGGSDYVQFMRGKSTIANSAICIDCHTAK